MIRSLNTAEKAMERQQVRIDALANNLANVNSTGFRQVLTRVAETVQPDGDDVGPDGAGRGLEVNKTLAQGTSWNPQPGLELYYATDTRQGPVRATGRETDVAITGRGYFTLQTPDGESYTRSGGFRLDSDKTLVTPEGLPVLGDSGPIKIDGDDFDIHPDGTVMVDGASVGRLKLVDFADATRLEHRGGNILKPTEEMEPQTVPVEEIAVAQGHLEGSNVNPINTLVAMIMAQRAFEVQSKITMTEDEMLSKSVNKLPQVSG